MTLPIEYAIEVREDIDSAYCWYEDRQPGWGERFLAVTSDAVTKIQSHPYRCGRVRGDVRAALTRDFPYVIYYRVDESRIVIIAVLHSRRDPQIWRRRN